MKVELLPCPFCGSNDIIVSLPIYSNTVIIGCNECNAMIESDDEEDTENTKIASTILNWNSRV